MTDHESTNPTPETHQDILSGHLVDLSSSFYDEYLKTVPEEVRSTWITSPVVGYEEVACGSIVNDPGEYEPGDRVSPGHYLRRPETTWDVNGEEIDVRSLIKDTLHNVHRSQINWKVIASIESAKPPTVIVGIHENGMRTVSGKQWAEWMGRAGFGSGENKDMNLMLTPPGYERWRAEQAFKAAAREVLKKSISIEHTVEEGEQWSMLHTSPENWREGYWKTFYNPAQGRMSDPISEGTKLQVSEWDVSLSEDRETFVLTQKDLGDTIQIDALGLRMAVDRNTRLSKRVINPEFPSQILVGEYKTGDRMFMQDDLSELIYPRLVSEQIAGDEMLIKGKRWVTEEITGDETYPANEDYMVDRTVVLKKVKEEYGEGVRLFRTYLRDDSNRKYEYRALLLPVGNTDDNGNELYDAFVECPEIDNAAFFVPYDKGDWREIIIGQTKEFAKAHGAIRQPHRPFDEEWDSARKAKWREEWEDTVLGLIFREHKAFQKSA